MNNVQQQVEIFMEEKSNDINRAMDFLCGRGCDICNVEIYKNHLYDSTKKCEVYEIGVWYTLPNKDDYDCNYDCDYGCTDDNDDDEDEISYYEVVEYYKMKHNEEFENEVRKALYALNGFEPNDESGK